MFTAGLKRRGFDWFDNFGLTNSYETVIRMNAKLLEKHDEEVVAWKKAIESKYEKLCEEFPQDEALKRVRKDPITPEYQVSIID